jgi:hypothetical protein
MSFQPDDARDRREDWDPRYEGDRLDPWERRRSPVDNARASVQAPGIILIVLGVLNLLGGLGLIGGGLALNGMTTGEYEAMATKDDPNALDELEDEGFTVPEFQDLYAFSLIGAGVFSLLAGAVLILGGSAIIGLKFYWLAMIATITAFVSPVGCCCLFGLIGAIWSFVTLINPDVRKSFT